MDLDNIECVSIPDDEIRSNNINPPSRPYHHGFLQNPKPQHHVNNANGNISVVVGSNVIPPTATSVHELLECPVCTNSMYPPIHQV